MSAKNKSTDADIGKGIHRDDSVVTAECHSESDSLKPCSRLEGTVILRRRLSKSVEDLCRREEKETSSGLRLRHSQRQNSLPLIDISSFEDEEYGLEITTTQNKENLETTSVGKLRQEEETTRLNKDQELEKTRLLNLPPSGASGKDIHYDYVRASMILQLQRITNLKRNVNRKVSEKSASEFEFDSDEGYVIEYQDEEEPVQQSDESENLTKLDASQNQYVTLVTRNEEISLTTAGPTATTETATVGLSSSATPPLYLDKHPNVTGSEEDKTDDYYEKTIIYEELGLDAEDEEDPHYDSIHQMRDRATQMVRGKHRKKLKKYIIRRKSSRRLPLVTKEETAETTIKPEPDERVESDSDLSDEEEEPVLKSKPKAKTVLSVPLISSPVKETQNCQARRRSHTCNSYLDQRLSWEMSSEVLDKSQYDRMMEMMLNDDEVKQLQDAGALKVKDIAELRAEIRRMVQSAPSVPPPLPDNARPRESVKGKKGFKKWSSKSLHVKR